MTDNAQEGGSTFSMNTVRLYGPKIKEWNAYCEAKEFTDGQTVSPEKVATFLQEEVVGRTRRRQTKRKAAAETSGNPDKGKGKETQNKRIRSNSGNSIEVGDGNQSLMEGNEENEHQNTDQGQEQEEMGLNDTGDTSSSTPAADFYAVPIGIGTVQAYVAALVDLWRKQVDSEGNTFTSPRDGPVAVIVEEVRKREATRVAADKALKMAKGADAGADISKDGYNSFSQLARILSHGLSKNSPQGLKERCMNAFAHSQLLKGLPLRQIQFSDLSILEPEDSPNFPILTTSLFNGRKKRLGVSQNVGAVRAVDWENCSFGALAFYLFWRFHPSEQPFGEDLSQFPSFDAEENLRSLYLFPSEHDVLTQVSDPDHSAAVKEALRAAGVQRSKGSTIFEASGSHMCANAGFPDETVPPREIHLQPIKVLAGWSVEETTFSLDRDTPVPESLLNQIWPSAEECLQKIEANDQDEEPSNRSSQKIAGFLRLLLHLRKVLLQDSVCLRKVQPDHIIFNHPIFYSQEYRTFESSTLQIQALRSQIPSNEVLRRMGPSVDAFQSDMSQRLLGVHDLLQKDDLVPVMVGMSELFTRYTQFTQQLSATKASADAQAEVEAAQAQAASTSMSTARDDNSNEVTSNASSSNGFTFFNGSVDQASGSGSGSGGSNSLGFAPFQ